MFKEMPLNYRQKKADIGQNKLLLYFVRFDSNLTNDIDECFWKIGVSTRSIKNRFYKGYEKFNYTPVKLFQGISYDIYQMESLIKKRYNRFQYIPKTSPFAGSTECFYEHIEFEHILEAYENMFYDSFCLLNYDMDYFS